MKHLSLISLSIFAVAGLSGCFMNTPKTYNYGGRYVASQTDSEPFFEAVVKQDSLNATIDFRTGKPNGSVTGTGIGNIDHDGSLIFTFEDRSGNQGTGKLSPSGETYQLSMSPTNVRNQNDATLFGSKVLERK